jgi:hypothetical protein
MRCDLLVVRSILLNLSGLRGYLPGSRVDAERSGCENPVRSRFRLFVSLALAVFFASEIIFSSLGFVTDGWLLQYYYAAIILRRYAPLLSLFLLNCCPALYM